MDAAARGVRDVNRAGNLAIFGVGDVPERRCRRGISLVQITDPAGEGARTFVKVYTELTAGRAPIREICGERDKAGVKTCAAHAVGSLEKRREHARAREKLEPGGLNGGRAGLMVRQEPAFDDARHDAIAS